MTAQDSIGHLENEIHFQEGEERRHGARGFSGIGNTDRKQRFDLSVGPVASFVPFVPHAAFTLAGCGKTPD
jgi:hypothetical protein